MSDKIKDLDEIVRNYLLTRGFTKAAAELDVESQKTNQASSSAPEENTWSRHIFSSISGDIVMLGARGGNVSFYFFEYEALQLWTKSSLDIVQPELLQITFPIFVHCYIGLVRVGALEEARLFWRKWEHEHRERFSDEMKELSMLTSQDQLASEDFLSSNSFINSVLRLKFRIVMSSFAYGIMTTFLIHNNLLLLAGIVNDKILVERVTDTPAAQEPRIQFDGDTRPNDDGSERGSSNRSREGGSNLHATLKLWAPGKGISSSSASVEVREDSLYREWIAKVAHPKAKLADWNIKKGGGSDSHFRDESSSGGDVTTAKRVKVSADTTKITSLSSQDKTRVLDPNIIFATVTNTHEDMSCVHINRSVTQAVAGFKDSCVRVWKLDESSSSKTSSRGFGTVFGGSGSWSLREVLPPTKGTAPALLPTGTFSQHHSSSVSDSSSSSSSSLMKPPMLELRGHRKPVYSVCQDDSGRIVLSGSADNTVRLWDTTVAQCVGKYDCLSPVWSVSLSPVGYYFAAACHNSTTQVFSTDRLAPIRLLDGHRSDVTAVSWHENGTLLGTCSDDRDARLWDMRSGKCVRLFEGSSSPLCSIAMTAFSFGNHTAAASMIAAGSDSGMVYLWDVGSSRKLAVLQGHEGAAHSVNFSRDGGAVVSGGADCSLRVFDTSSVLSSSSFLAAQKTVSRNNDDSSQNVVSTSLSSREAVPIINAYKTYHTKYSPVFFVDVTRHGMIYAGGPFSLPSATNAIESRRVAGNGAGEAAGGGGVSESSSIPGGVAAATAASETDTVSALGLSHTVLLTS